MNKTIRQVFLGIDWRMLRDQKEWLVEQAHRGGNEEAEGLLALLDEVQDAAVFGGIATKEEVFGTEE
jgi:predicted type IV restriction endonuclease